jgi:hypothetical protein
LLRLEILDDHYRNVLSRETVRGQRPGTEQTVLLEGWVRAEDYAKLGGIEGRFDAASVGRSRWPRGREAGRDREHASVASVRSDYAPVRHAGGDGRGPDAVPAPFLALFFGICLTDAAYGIVMIAVLGWVLKKIRATRSSSR